MSHHPVRRRGHNNSHFQEQLKGVLEKRREQGTLVGQQFTQMVANLETVNKTPGLILSDRFEVVKKSGCSWIPLCLLRPFYALFGGDVYRHYRVDAVIQAMLQACQENRALLKTNEALRGRLEQGLESLDTKTKKKYEAAIRSLKDAITTIVTPKPQSTVRASHIAPVKLLSVKPDPSAMENKSSVHGDTRSSRKGTKISRQDRTSSTLPVDVQKLAVQWPADEDLEFCGIDVQAFVPFKESFTGLVMQCLQTHGAKLKFVKEGEKGARERTLQMVGSDDQVVRQIKTPLSLEVIYDDEGRLKDVILLTKYIVAVGGETKVRLCYSLFRGSQLVRKNCFGQLQQQLLGYFHAATPPGVVGIRGMRRVGDKVQSIEDFWIGSLREFISQQDKPSFANLMKIARDLLLGIQAVHEVECDRYEYGERESTGNFKLFHLDITPANVLLNMERDGAAVTDFGSAHPENIGGTAGFKAPEQIALCRTYKKMTAQQIVQHNLTYGQMSDYWSIGLVLAALFTWQVDPLGGPPLRCIEHSLKMAAEQEDRMRQKGAKVDALTLDKSIGLLKQEEIDTDLRKLEDECVRALSKPKDKIAMRQVWEVIKGMVKTSAETRMSIERALQLLQPHFPRE